MLQIIKSKKFKKDVELAKKSGLDLTLLYDVVLMLAKQQTLPASYHDHPLIGNLDGFRECHIKPDWLLIYYIDEKDIELFLFRTGSHSRIFNK